MIAEPHKHPGRECSSDCAEYGCAEWTAVDPAVLAVRAPHLRTVTLRTGGGGRLFDFPRFFDRGGK